MHRAFAGQTFDRTVHKGDLTGIEIINRLAEQVWARGIARLEIVIGDGAEAVPQRPASCDVLVVDGFVNGSPAKDLCTRSFYDGAFAALRPGGVMVANFMSDDKRIENYCGRIEESFGRDPTLLLAEEEDNFIAFALRDGPQRIPWAELKGRARTAQRLFDLPLEECLADLRRRNSHTTQFLTL